VAPVLAVLVGPAADAGAPRRAGGELPVPVRAAEQEADGVTVWNAEDLTDLKPGDRVSLFIADESAHLTVGATVVQTELVEYVSAAEAEYTIGGGLRLDWDAFSLGLDESGVPVILTITVPMPEGERSELLRLAVDPPPEV
jgi:hypothetical protein